MGIMIVRGSWNHLETHPVGCLWTFEDDLAALLLKHALFNEAEIA